MSQYIEQYNFARETVREDVQGVIDQLMDVNAVFTDYLEGFEANMCPTVTEAIDILANEFGEPVE